MKKTDKNNSNGESAKKRYAVLSAIQNSGAQEEEETGSSFMQLYAALMILLMTFFIVIYSQSVTSQAKFEMAKDSLYKVFETTGLLQTREMMLFFKQQEKNSKADEEKQETSKIQVSLADIIEKLEEEFQGCSVDLMRDQTIINIPEGKVFVKDGYSFSENGKVILDSIIAYIKKDAYTQITINTHFMSVLPDQGTEDSRRKDWLFSSMRAIAVAQYFAENELDYEKIAALSFGNTQPATKYVQTLVDLAKQNRVEVIIKNETQGPSEDLYLKVS